MIIVASLNGRKALQLTTPYLAWRSREKKIIHLRFFEGKTQMEVAEEIGISQAQVSRLEKGALLNLKRYM